MGIWSHLKHCYRRICADSRADLPLQFASIDLTNTLEVVQRSSEWLHSFSSAQHVMWLSCKAMTADTQSSLAPTDCFSLSAFEIPDEVRVRCRSEGSQTTDLDGYLILPVFDPRNGNWIGSFLLKDAKVGITEMAPQLSVVSTCLSYAFAFESMRQLSYKDDVTSLYNQRYLPLVLSQEMSRAAREQRNVSVLFLDVDFFKAVNDANGHMVGSQVLVQIGEVLQQCTRNYDYVFRYGGDEFVVVLPNTTSSQAFDVAERIRAQVAASTFLVRGVNVQVTVSIGVATFPDHAQSAEQVLHLADQAMYYGKNASRNVVYMAT